MTRTLTADLHDQIGKQTSVMGWVNSRRDHGGLVFIDLRDHKGLVQLTITPDTADVFAIAEGLRDEFVIEATGTVKERAADLVNKNISTGDLEITVSAIRILNKSETPPIQINSDQHISEENRLKYRYLDLRRAKMQTMLKRRAEMYQIMRSYMDGNEFTEITTPVLANSSPEGARDFLVPSRLHNGNYYALPQAPQQFKQLLMVGGVARYYQMAACFRDEDPRADRLYGEFYQLDMEMAFVEQGSVIRDFMTPLIKSLVTDFAGKKLLSEDVLEITYADAMNKYGSDKPDLRYGLELVDLTVDLNGCGFGVFSGAIEKGGVVKAICAPASFSRKQIDKLTDAAKQAGAGGLPYLKVEDGLATGAIAKFFSPEHLQAIVSKMAAKDGDTILFGVDKLPKANKVLGVLRARLGTELDLKDPNIVALAWVVDFPFYEVDEATGKLDFGHNPFSMPKGGLDAIKNEDKTAIVADQYDMVMNGYEICSGGVRNHNPDVMYEVFGVLGYDKDYVEAKFGAMLSAFKFGAPPHAGCAFGIDRMLMELLNETNIREVVAFPKNGSGMDVMMNSPSPAEPALLKELGLKTL